MSTPASLRKRIDELTERIAVELALRCGRCRGLPTVLRGIERLGGADEDAWAQLGNRCPVCRREPTRIVRRVVPRPADLVLA